MKDEELKPKTVESAKMAQIGATHQINASNLAQLSTKERIMNQINALRW
jgi:hypothetical protein